TNADGSVTFDGLEPESFTLIVHLEGTVARKVPISGLRSGETRDVEVLLDEDAGTGTIEGVLFADDAVMPLAKRTVALYAPARVADAASSRWFFPLPTSVTADGMTSSLFVTSGPLDSMRIGKARAQTDEEGRFRFSDVPMGRWILRYSSKAGIDSV